MCQQQRTIYLGVRDPVTSTGHWFLLVSFLEGADGFLRFRSSLLSHLNSHILMKREQWLVGY